MSILVLGINPSNGRGAITTLRRLPLWMSAVGVDSYAFANCLPYKGSIVRRTLT